MSEAAILVLADGSVFHGKVFGTTGFTIGEVVFNTSMTGYQEILTDPSYTKQIVTLTYPHIGNTGTNNEDTESNQVYASGLIIRDLPLQHSNFRSQSSLADYLKQNNIVAISEIDTRRLTRLLRDKGAQVPGFIQGFVLASCGYIPAYESSYEERGIQLERDEHSESEGESRHAYQLRDRKSVV